MTNYLDRKQQATVFCQLRQNEEKDIITVNPFTSSLTRKHELKIIPAQNDELKKYPISIFDVLIDQTGEVNLHKKLSQMPIRSFLFEDALFEESPH